MVGRIAAIAALVAVVVAVVLLVAGGGDDDYEITAEFTNASQLVGGEVVTVGGTTAGKVTDIELADNGNALVSFTVDDQYAPLHEETVAQVRSFSLSGIANRQIELTLPPDEAGGGEIEDGGTLSRVQTISEVDIDQIFNTLDPETISDFKKVIKGFAISFAGTGEEANAGFKYLNPFLSTSRRTFSELTRDTRSLEQLIVNGAALSKTLASRRDDLSQLVGNLDLMMNAIARQRTSLTTAVRELPDFMRRFNTTSVNLRATLDDLDPLVDASKPVAVRLRPFFRNFRSASANLVPTVRDLDEIIKDPGEDNDLVDLTRLQPQLSRIAVGPVRRNGARRQGALPEAATALREGLDELAFFRAYQPELTGWFDDFGHSGLTDANGGIGRIGTTFNTFSVAPASGLPVLNFIDLLNGLTGSILPSAFAQTPLEEYSGLSTGNYRRCPGSNERPYPDGSNPWTDGGQVDCDPSIVPPGE